MEAEVKAAKDNIGALRVSYEAASSSAASSAQVDRDALAQARADLDAISMEAKALRAAHTAALQDATAKLKEYETQAANVETLEKQLAALKAEKEDTVYKLSELEIEILELKDSQGKEEDAKGKVLANVKALEEHLAETVAATRQAIDDATAKGVEHVQNVTDIKNAYEEELKALASEQAKSVAQLDVIQKELATSQAAHSLAKTDIQAMTEDYVRNLSEAEQIHLAKQNELAEQIKKITDELEVRLYTLWNYESHFILAGSRSALQL